MHWHRYIFISLVIVLSSCATVDSSKLSGWRDLQESNDLSCSPVSKPEATLRINDVMIASDGNLYVDTMGRGGSSDVLWGEYSDALKFKLLRKTVLPEGQRIIGAGFKKGTFTVIVRDAENRYISHVIENKRLRKLKDGQLTGLLKKAFVTDQSEYFIGFEDKGEELSYFVTTYEGKNLKVGLESDDARFVNFANRDYLLSVDGSKVLITDLTGNKSVKTLSFDAPVTHFEAVERGNLLVLAVIYGDSYSDTQTTLAVNTFSLAEEKLNVDSSSTKSLADINIGSLKLYPCGPDTCLLMNQWIDVQTTMVAYKVDGKSNLLDRSLYGKMDKPQFIRDAYFDPKSGKTLFVTREKAKSLWNFNLCRF